MPETEYSFLSRNFRRIADDIDKGLLWPALIDAQKMTHILGTYIEKWHEMSRQARAEALETEIEQETY